MAATLLEAPRTTSSTARSDRFRLVPAVDKAARLLLELDPMRPRGISDLARRIEASKGTVRDILMTLAAHGFVTRDADGRFRAAWPRVAPEAARRHLDLLMRQTGHTAIFGVLRGSKMEIVMTSEPPTELHMAAPIGLRVPLRAGAHRRVLVEGAEVAHDDEEYLAGVRAAAAPVKDPAGRPIGAVLAVGFKDQIDAREMRRMGGLCVAAADAISEAVAARALA